MRSSARTFYVCKGTEGSSGTAARLLHIIAFGGFVDLRMGKKNKTKTKTPNRNEQKITVTTRYRSTMKIFDSKVRTQVRGAKASRAQGDPFSALLQRKENPLQLWKHQNMPMTARAHPETNPPHTSSPKGHHLP